MMQQLNSKSSQDFYTRKVSINQAIKSLKRNGIQVDEERVKVILDFLYLLAKTYKPTKP